MQVGATGAAEMYENMGFCGNRKIDEFRLLAQQRVFRLVRGAALAVAIMAARQ